MPNTFTTGQVAKRLGVEVWQLLRTIRLGHLAEPIRLGHFRVWVADDLPRVEAALRKAGYLKEATGVS
jgi:hypothetical protein